MDAAMIRGPARRAAFAAILAILAVTFAGCWYYSAPPRTIVATNCTTKTYGFLIFRTYTTTCEASAQPTPSTAVSAPAGAH
jgi:hypothetical protein